MAASLSFEGRQESPINANKSAVPSANQAVVRRLVQTARSNLMIVVQAVARSASAAVAEDASVR